MLRREHHCVLVNTCIGFRNQHYFIAFLAFLSASALYVSLASTHVLSTALLQPPSGLAQAVGSAADARAPRGARRPRSRRARGGR